MRWRSFYCPRILKISSTLPPQSLRSFIRLINYTLPVLSPFLFHLRCRAGRLPCPSLLQYGQPFSPSAADVGRRRVSRWGWPGRQGGSRCELSFAEAHPRQRLVPTRERGGKHGGERRVRPSDAGRRPRGRQQPVGDAECDVLVPQAPRRGRRIQLYCRSADCGNHEGQPRDGSTTERCGLAAPVWWSFFGRRVPAFAAPTIERSAWGG